MHYKQKLRSQVVKQDSLHPAVELQVCASLTLMDADCHTFVPYQLQVY